MGAGIARHGAAAGPGRGPAAGGRDLHPAGRHRRPAHSDKELAEANFKGYGHHPLLAACDNMGEPLAWMLRPGSAGSNTAADHLRLLGEAIAALPPALRRKLMVTCDGAGASHDLVKRAGPARARGTATRSPTPSAGRWAPGRRPRSARSPRPPGKPRSTARARSASAAPRRPARTRAAPHRSLLDTGSARHRADRAAARGPGRRPAQGLAEDDAHLRPPRAAPPRRAAVPVRGRRRLALLPVGHEPARRTREAGAASAPTSTPPTASTPASRTSSAPARTPGSGISPPMTTG